MPDVTLHIPRPWRPLLTPAGWFCVAYLSSLAIVGYALWKFFS